MTNFSRDLTMKFRNVRYGINTEKKIITCIIDVDFNHYVLGLVHCLSPKEYRRLVSVCGSNLAIYDGGFTITGKAKCFRGDETTQEDEFDERKGMRIAYRRAKRKALRRCRAILKFYNKILTKMSSELINNIATLDSMIEFTDEQVNLILNDEG